GQVAVCEAEGGGEDVVLDDDREAEHRLESVAEREVVPAEIHGERHVASLGVHAPRHADADRLEVAPLEGRTTERLVQARSDGRDGAALVTPGGGVGGGSG